MYSEDDYLLISGLQHFSFCRRQWALIHIENQWSENYYTVDGEIMHEKTHDPYITEKRRDIIVSRSLPVKSEALGLTGCCDIVEFRENQNGVAIRGRENLWLPCPVEYKRGRPKQDDTDALQLCAQAICLEEMFCCPEIKTAYLYYGETRRREPVELGQELRFGLKEMTKEMHALFGRRYTPMVKKTKKCAECSLADICLPALTKKAQASEYINHILFEENDETIG